MYTAHLRSVFVRELATLKEELLAYDDEAAIWQVPPGISNSAGTLALHMVGNLQHFVGAVLGGSGYARQRDAEFASRDVPRGELLAGVDAAIAALEVLDRLSDEELEAAPRVVFGDISVGADEFVIHLLSHLSFHLGQVNYHRRLVTGVRGDVKVLQIPKLSTVE